MIQSHLDICLLAFYNIGEITLTERMIPQQTPLILINQKFFRQYNSFSAYYIVLRISRKQHKMHLYNQTSH